MWDAVHTIQPQMLFIWFNFDSTSFQAKLHLKIEFLEIKKMIKLNTL